MVESLSGYGVIYACFMLSHNIIKYFETNSPGKNLTEVQCGQDACLSVIRSLDTFDSLPVCIKTGLHLSFEIVTYKEVIGACQMPCG